MIYEQKKGKTKEVERKQGIENKFVKILLIDNNSEDVCIIRKVLSKVRDVLSDKRD